MKFTVTYKESNQISPDDWEAHTRVTHFLETDTLRQVFEKVMVNKSYDMDVELHCSKDKK